MAHIGGSRAVGRRMGAVAVTAMVIAAGCSDGDDTDRPPATSTTAPLTTTAPATTTPPSTAAGTTATTAPPSTAPATTTAPDASAATVRPLADVGGGRPQTAAALDLAARGYVEEEYVVTGEAVAYTPDGAFGSDGHWAVTAGAPAPYTTRVLVRRPTAADFNGTVVVEWLNVSSQIDLDAEFAYVAEEVLREGYAWVGVSAQAAGVESTQPSGDFGPGAVGLKAWDPARYGELSHPGDAYSYAIFSAVGAALRAPGPVDPLGGLQPDVVLAAGESQSAFRLVTYVNAVHPRARVYDGFLIHSRDGASAPLGDGFEGAEIPSPVFVRDDLDVPVFEVQSEGDLYELWAGRLDRAFPPARQADTERLRTWEIAGTAHSDRHMLEYIAAQGSAQFTDFTDLSAIFSAVNDGPHTFVARAALRGLRDWVADGTPPARAEPIATAGEAVARDELGLAVGGIRTPTVEVPVEVNTGAGLPLAGSRTDLDPAAVAARYPTKDAYVAEVTTALDAVIAAGFVLADDRTELLEWATAKYPAG